MNSLWVATLPFALLTAPCFAGPVSYELRLSKLEFTAPTSVKAFEVNGSSTEGRGSARLDGDRLTELSFAVPVESLTTGMRLRDRHMRERIFQTADGKLPAVVYSGDTGQCRFEEANVRCRAQGRLAIRGKPRPVALTAEGSRNEPLRENSLKLRGVFVIRLSDFGIARPAQLGVTVADEVTLRFEVQGERR